MNYDVNMSKRLSKLNLNLLTFVNTITHEKIILTVLCIVEFVN